jgi:DNA polymerase III subunit delta
MVALKSAEIDRFMARPNKPVVLVFGPDSGLVRERVDALVRAAVDDPRDPFSLARLEGDALAEAPERLVEEAHTIPLFGGRRAVWVQAGSRAFTVAIERVLAAPPGDDCRIVIEAGDLRRGAPLRSLCERAPNAAALPCYADSGRDLDRLIEEEMRAAATTISPDARTLLAGLIGGDRSASRSEIRKLALYAHGKPRIELDDVVAVVADATLPALDGLVDAAFAGRPAELETNFAKARLSGVTTSAIASALSRQASVLHRRRLTVESGTSARNAVESAMPMIHFSRREAVQAALDAWSAARLERLIAQLGDAALDARKYAKLTYPIVQRALLSIAVAARRRAET